MSDKLVFLLMNKAVKLLGVESKQNDWLTTTPSSCKTITTTNPKNYF